MLNVISAIFSLSASLSIFLGSAGSPDYIRTTGFIPAIEALQNRETIENTSFVGEVSDEYWDISMPYNLEDTVVLKKDKNKDFVILNLSDIHFADYGEKTIHIPDTTKTIRSLIEDVQPDLITVTGDIVCTDSDYYAVRRFTDLMESFGIPWVPILGNHDDEGNCDLNFIADTMLTAPNCILKKGNPEMGVGNYIINIAEENNNGSLNVVESLIMMYTHNTQPNDKQILWYEWDANGINKLTDKNAEITIFCHITLPEYQFAYDLAWDSDNNCWRDGYDAYGECNETVACQRDVFGEPYQKGFFNVIKRTETTDFIFCGHDHLNNFSIMYEGVRLSYTLKTGHASGFMLHFNGGTQIQVGSTGINNIKHKTVLWGSVVTIENIDV